MCIRLLPSEEEKPSAQFGADILGPGEPFQSGVTRYPQSWLPALKREKRPPRKTCVYDRGSFFFSYDDEAFGYLLLHFFT